MAILAQAAFPPAPEGLMTKQIANKPAVSISYKKVKDLLAHFGHVLMLPDHHMRD